MTDNTNNVIDCRKIKNIEAPFTELFSLLKQYENISGQSITLAYKSEELKAIYQHADNAMSILLQGIQDLGRLLSITAQNDKNIINELNNIGSFITTITNLTEAINDLRNDSEYSLRIVEDIDY